MSCLCVELPCLGVLGKRAIGPVHETGMKGKMKLEKFWEDLGQLLKKFENVRRVFLLGDMNVRVGSTEIGGVVGRYGVEGVN